MIWLIQFLCDYFRNLSGQETNKLPSFYTLAHQCGWLNSLKTWEILKRNSRHKNREFNTASCCLLVVCHSSFKRGFPYSASIEKKESHAILKQCLSGPCCQCELWLFHVTKHLNEVLWATCHGLLDGNNTSYVPRDEAVHMVLGSSKQLLHAGLCGTSKKFHIYPSNDDFNFLGST